jgi:2-succinyl-5-enolpyruvyl-6-hydroxy-3-cyclohexene-1-carboxylate synthase
MPLYFFHLISPAERCLDDLGSHLPDVEQAYLEVYQAALDISFEMLRLRRDPSQLRFEVTNESGEVLFDLPFSEALHPTNKAASLTSLHEKLRQNFDRQRALTSEFREQVQKTLSTISTTRDLLARALPR